MEAKDLKTLAGTIAAHFAQVSQESSNTTTARKERVALIFATIKRDAPKMSDGEQVALTYAFGVECSNTGMSQSTVAVRRSELLFLLEHSSLIEDGADAWRPTVDRIRKSLKSARQNLEDQIKTAHEAVIAAQKRLAELEAEMSGLENAELVGVV